MCGKTRRDMIRHDNIREIIGVASTVKKKKKKVLETRLRLFGHVGRSPVDSVVRRLDQKHIKINELDTNMVYRICWSIMPPLIHVTYPTQWDRLHGSNDISMWLV